MTRLLAFTRWLSRSRRLWIGWMMAGIAIGLIWGSGTIAVAAKTPPKLPPIPLTVATRVIPPFVNQENGTLSGFSIDLWRKISEQMGAQTQFKIYPTLPAMLTAVRDRSANVAIAAISMTMEREQEFDFSHPMFTSGLQILVRRPERSSLVPNLVRDLFSPVLLQLVGIALLMVMIAAHIIWWFERRHPDTMISQSYFPGIFEAAWWAAATLATQADQMPRGPLGRVIAIVWMFTAVVFVAYFTATVTTGMTVQKLQGDIKSMDDLAGRVVATTKGSTAAEFLREKGIQTIEPEAITEAYTALLANQAEAVVFDAPVLMYYAAHDGRGKVMLVGEVFRDESYGILLPRNSPHRKAINAALLHLKESGDYGALYQRWFKPRSLEAS